MNNTDDSLSYDNEHEAREILRRVLNVSRNDVEVAGEITPEFGQIMESSFEGVKNMNSLVFTENQVETLVTSIFDSVNKRIADRIVQDLKDGDVNHVPSSDIIRKHIENLRNDVNDFLDKKAALNHTHIKDDIIDFPEEHDWSREIQQEIETHSISTTTHKDIRNRIIGDNLLDNGYFVGGGSQQGGGKFPINQKGRREYKNEYSIDRWYFAGGALRVEDDCITIEGAMSVANIFSQSIENPYIIGKTCTLSYMLPGNELITSTIKIPEKKMDQALWYGLKNGWGSSIQVDEEKGIVSLSIRKDDTTDKLSLIAVKLELGSEQTLAHKEGDTWVLNDPPDPSLELAKCQRYQVVIGGYDGTPFGIFYGYETSGTVSMFIPLPVVMREGNASTTFIGEIVLLKCAPSYRYIRFVPTILVSKIQTNMCSLTISNDQINPGDSGLVQFPIANCKLIIDKNL